MMSARRPNPPSNPPAVHEFDTGPARRCGRIGRRCRSCGAPLDTLFVDLGTSPLCERFLTADQLKEMEPFYPLDVRICDACLLVQVPTYVAADELFRE